MKRGIMFYKDILEELLEKEKNPVNSMYLHEIGLKWKNFEKAAAEKKGSNENLVNALNKFIKAISNRKFKFNAVSEKGFKEDSDVFSNYFLNDLISILTRSEYSVAFYPILPEIFNLTILKLEIFTYEVSITLYHTIQLLCF